MRPAVITWRACCIRNTSPRTAQAFTTTTGAATGAMPERTAAWVWASRIPGSRGSSEQLARQSISLPDHCDNDTWTEESWTRECDKSEVLASYSGWHELLLQLFAAGERHYKWA